MVGSLLPPPQRGLFTEPARAAQPPDAAAVRRADRLSRVRGLLLGLALGDALTRPDPPGAGPLPATPTAQLACFTAEGLIRALVRTDHTGGAASPVAVWFAYRRWARAQGIPVPRPIEPSGWLARVPALAERRGDAAEVVAALQAARDTVPGPPPNTARGHHALSPRLPLAAVVAPAEWTREVVLATHGRPGRGPRGGGRVELARTAVATGSVAASLRSISDPLLDAARDPAASPASLAPDDSAVSALRGRVVLAARCPGPDAIAGTLLGPRSARPGAVGPLAGALLGGAHGAESLPTELVTRLELGWIADTLARDLVTQLEDRPGGTARQQPADRHWWRRYPDG